MKTQTKKWALGPGQITGALGPVKNRKNKNKINKHVTIITKRHFKVQTNTEHLNETKLNYQTTIVYKTKIIRNTFN